jgi:hypothetical protein
MSESDPIVDEVRRIRDAHAAKFNYDLDAIFRDIKEQEKRSGCTYVSFADDRVAPNETLQPTGAAIPASCEDKPLPAAPAAELDR